MLSNNSTKSPYTAKTGGHISFKKITEVSAMLTAAWFAQNYSIYGWFIYIYEVVWLMRYVLRYL